MTHSDRLTSKLAQVRELAERKLKYHVHGVHCPKRKHTRDGMLHSEDDDTPYEVDGVAYCGRCHHCLSSQEIAIIHLSHVERAIPALLKALEHALDTQRMLSEVHLAKSFNPTAFIAHRNAELADLLAGKGGGE